MSQSVSETAQLKIVQLIATGLGVGQYQHDVTQRALARALDATVEDCVNVKDPHEVVKPGQIVKVKVI